jgi:hypothetical protein
MNVYEAINAVQSDLVKHGIGKDSENKFDGYKFRGIDAVYNALSPLLAKHGLCVLPRMLTRTCEERQSQKGGALFYVTVEAEFDFVSAKDGSRHTVRTFGEAMDRGDKATNKAMSAAYKYAAFQAFAIPTEGDNDADATTHEVAQKDMRANPSKLVAESVEDHISAERKDDLTEDALKIVTAFKLLRTDTVMQIYDSITDNDEKAFLWHLLAKESKIRTFIKAQTAERRKAREVPEAAPVSV